MDQNLYEQIDKYLDKDLVPKELKSFEEKLKQSLELREEVELQKRIRKGIRIKNKESIRELVKKNQKNPKKGTAKIKKINFKTLAMAASIVLAIGLGVFLFTNNSQAISTSKTIVQMEQIDPFPGQAYAKSEENFQRNIEVTMTIDNNIKPSYTFGEDGLNISAREKMSSIRIYTYKDMDEIKIILVHNKKVYPITPTSVKLELKENLDLELSNKLLRSIK